VIFGGDADHERLRSRASRFTAARSSNAQGLSAVPCDLAEPLLGPRAGAIISKSEPCIPDHRCTTGFGRGPFAVRARRPVPAAGPGGMNDLTNASVFTQLDERRVKVTGSRFVRDETYRVKLEGASTSGFRSVVLVGIRDPAMIAGARRVSSSTCASAPKAFGSSAKACSSISACMGETR
jgi:hypothetical protein